MYRLLFRLLLRRVDPERAHALAKGALRLVRSTPSGRALVRDAVGPPATCLRTRALGFGFSTPIGVAAGLDKGATWFEDLAALGFGFVEVGTITARSQAGNPPPRVVRVVKDRALVNRMGFPNPGAAVAAANLARRGRRPIVGVNIGKSAAVPMESAGNDYRAAVRQLAPVADYLVLNVSSPNTPGLRDLHATDRLRALVSTIREELAAIGSDPPLLIKIGPDLDDDRIDAISSLALELKLDGIVAVNTTVDRSALGEPSAVPFDGGGVSGAPVRARALEVLRRIRGITADRLVLISVGGVESAEDAWARILAGASLVQVYTAFVYEGPGWAKRTNRELAEKVRRAGVSSIEEMIGAAERGCGDGTGAPTDPGGFAPLGLERGR